MDTNIPIQSSQPIQSENLTNQSVPEIPSRKPKIIWILIAVAILIIVGTSSYYLGTKRVIDQKQENIVTVPTVIRTAVVTQQTPISSPTSKISLNLGTGLEIYNNPAGFSLVYQHQGKGFDCSLKELTVPRKVFEENNYVYIASDFSTVYGNDSRCTTEKTTTQLLKNAETGEQPYAMGGIRYEYQKINSDADLKRLAQSFGSDCVSLRKTLIRDGVYSIEVGDENNHFWNDRGADTTKCFTNYGYDFFYSEKNKVAVAGNTLQQCPAEIVKTQNGFDHGCIAQIVFP